MSNRINAAGHKMRRESHKFQRWETVQQRKELAQLMQVQENAKKAFDKIQQCIRTNEEYPRSFWGEMHYLIKCIRNYWENFMPWMNTEKLEQIQKEKDFIDAKDSINRLQTNITGTFVWPFDIHIGNLKWLLEKYWEEFIPWITTKKLQELQKNWDYVQAKENTSELQQDLTEWRRFALQKKLTFLKAFVDNYGDNAVPWITSERVHDLAIKSREILWKTQKWIVKHLYKNDMIFVSPDNGDRDVVIKDNQANLLEWDAVEFVIVNNDNVKLLKKVVEA